MQTQRWLYLDSSHITQQKSIHVAVPLYPQRVSFTGRTEGCVSGLIHSLPLYTILDARAWNMTATDLHIVHSELWCHFFCVFSRFLAAVVFCSLQSFLAFRGFVLRGIAVHGGSSQHPPRSWQIFWPPTLNFYRQIGENREHGLPMTWWAQVPLQGADLSQVTVVRRTPHFSLPLIYSESTLTSTHKWN